MNRSKINFRFFDSGFALYVALNCGNLFRMAEILGDSGQSCKVFGRQLIVGFTLVCFVRTLFVFRLYALFGLLGVGVRDLFINGFDLLLVRFELILDVLHLSAVA